jgi:hypothetical protein
VYCNSACHEIKPKYALPKHQVKKPAAKSETAEAPVHLR